MPQHFTLADLSLSHSFQAECNNTIIPNMGNKGQNNFRGSFSPENLSSQHVMHVFLVHSHYSCPPHHPHPTVLASVYFKTDAACMKLLLRQEIEKHTVEGNMRIV